MSRINQRAAQFSSKPTYSSTDLEVWIESYDSFGAPKQIDFKDVVSFKLTSNFYVLKCRLNNICSENSNENLGSVVFSECFLLQEGCFLLLTKNIAYFDFWACSQERNDLLKDLNPNFDFKELGQIVHSEGLKNRMFVPL